MLWSTLPILVFHLLCVNLASAGPLVCMLYEWGEGKGDLAAGRAGRSLASASLVALILGVASGLLLGWMRWSPELSSALSQLSRKVMFGSIEIVFSLVLMVWHWWWWRGPESRARWGRQIVLLLAGTNLIYHFPTLFSILAHLQATGPSAEPVTAADFRQLLAVPQVLAQSLHVAVASFAVAATWLIWRSCRLVEAGDRATARWAAGIALAATVLQWPIGIWLTIVQPQPAQRKLMGQDPAATVAFLLSLVGVLALMHHLSAVAFRDEPGNSRSLSVYLTIAIVATMTTAMWLIR